MQKRGKIISSCASLIYSSKFLYLLHFDEDKYIIYLMNFDTLSQIPTPVLFALYLWTIAVKGFSLWRAASLKQRNWFIGLLLLNTLGILEVVYLFFFATKKLKLSELKFWGSK